MKTVLIIGGNRAYHEMFMAHGWTTLSDVDAKADDKFDLVCFTGGADVTPSFYGQKPISQTHSDLERDKYEKELFEGFNGKTPMVGICRGGQFLNVMCGGGLWQDVDGHTVHGGHMATDVATGYKFQVSSTHHQMMRESADGLILTESSESNYLTDDSGTYSAMDCDTEVVLYPKQKVLCFQPHPEFKGFAECTKAFFKYLERIV